MLLVEKLLQVHADAPKGPGRATLSPDNCTRAQHVRTSGALGMYLPAVLHPVLSMAVDHERRHEK